MTDPTEIITRARKLCEAATPGPWERDMDQVWTELHEPVVSFADPEDAEFIAASITLVPELADALEAKERELVETLDRKLFSRRELERLHGRVCDAVGMLHATTSHNVGDRIEMVVKALERERDKQGTRADEAELELCAISENFPDDTDLAPAIEKQTKDLDEVNGWWGSANEALCLLPGMSWDETDCESLVPNAQRCVAALIRERDDARSECDRLRKQNADSEAERRQLQRLAGDQWERA